MKDAHPGKQVQVWFQDEARFGQQGPTTRMWARKGSRPSAIRQCKYKWLYLYDAVCPETGNSAAMIAPWVNACTRARLSARVLRLPRYMAM